MDDFMTGDLSYAVAVPDTPDASLTVQVRHTRVGEQLVALLLMRRDFFRLAWLPHQQTCYILDNFVGDDGADPLSLTNQNHPQEGARRVRYLSSNLATDNPDHVVFS